MWEMAEAGGLPDRGFLWGRFTLSRHCGATARGINLAIVSSLGGGRIPSVSHRSVVDHSMKRRTPAVVLLIAFALAVLCSALRCQAESTAVEYVTESPPPTESLGTRPYEPSERERPFFEQLSAEEIKTGGLAGPYELTNKAGKYVGWFGIVREIEEDKPNGRTVLTVEHKYSDGLTDAHIMALSFNGSGDFRAVLRGTGYDMPLLTLVKVYGTVALETDTGRPRVYARFVRNWHWGTFTFLHAEGQQRGSQQWRNLNKVAPDRIYEPVPYPEYYEQRLGRRNPEPARRGIIEKVGPVGSEVAAPLSDLVVAVLTADEARAGKALAEVRLRGGEEAAIRALVACLGGDDYRVRELAGQLFWQIGRPAVKPLVEALKDERQRVRAEAAMCLQYVGLDAGEAVGDLTRALNDPCPMVRELSARVLGDLRGAARPALAELTRLLDDPDSHVRLDAAKAVWAVTFEPDPAIRRICRTATSAADSTERYSAVEALGDTGHPEAIPTLLQALKDEDPYVRAIAADALGNFPENADRIVPSLVVALQDEDSYVRAEAARSLETIGPASIVALPRLIALLDDEDRHVRLTVLGALESLGSKAADAIPQLVEVHNKDQDELNRAVALRVLSKIDAEGKSVLPLLLLALEDPNPQTRRIAAESLGELGRHAAGAVEKLIERLHDPDKGVRVYAAGALWKIDRRGDLAVPVLIDALNSGSPYERMWAACTVAEIGPDARAAARALVDNFTQETPQALAAWALCRIGPLPPDVIQALRRAKESESVYVKMSAARALWDVDHDPKLLEYLASPPGRYGSGSIYSLAALAELGPEAKPVVPALVDLLRHPDIAVRRQAAKALQEIDPSALEQKGKR